MFIVVFILTLFILVIIHELGHFLMAKKFGIKVLEFGFGLPPKLFGKKVGETIVSLNWLPFGGFVRLLGEDEVDKSLLENERSFAAQSGLKRALVVIAGVVMNLILAWVLFWIVLAAQSFRVQLPLLTDHKFVGVNQVNEKMILVGGIEAGSPADQAGIKAGDRVIALNDEFLTDSRQFVEKTKENEGKKIKLTLSDPRKTSYKTVEITPRVKPPEGQGAVGVSIGSFEVANLNYQETWQKALSGPIHSFNLATYSFEILGNTISTAFIKKDIAPVTQNVAGPIGITSIVKEILAVKNPLIPYLDFMAALSLNLAIVNILPFPGLDGGRLLFIVIEGITRRKTHAAVEKYVHTIGLMILLGLIFLITLSDIKKILF